MKRFIDLTITIPLFLVISPLLLMTIILQLIFTGLPLFYLQERVGIYSKTFVIYKFRTMKNGNNNDEEVFGDNPYVTNFGRILRRYKIDELPQLINIIKGEMTLVGPRPLTPEVQLTLKSEKRLTVKPGLTGLAQVNGNIHLTREERIILDERYVDERNIFIDIHILIKTLLVVLVGEKKFKI